MVAPRSRPDAEWVSVNEAASIVGRSRRTIYEWITRNLLTTRRVAGGPLQVKVSSLFQEEPVAVAALEPSPTSMTDALAPDDAAQELADAIEHDDIEIDVE